MSFYDNSSLAFLPSSGAGKDGKAYSIKPTNGTGDFTFSRGSNLAATRVGPTGLIEKGRENLLLQSNQFDTTWAGNTSNRSITSGFSGYDGTNNAWKLEAISDNNYSVVNQLVSSAGVETFSVYAKAGTSNAFRIQITGGVNTSASYFDLSGSGSVGVNFNNIDAKIESVGNGWFRCSVTGNKTTSSSCVIYVIDAEGSTNVTTGANIYIQDAQLEIGLAATDYIESGATTGKAGLLEDEPRFDYSGGATCPSLLLEPSRTNLAGKSEYIGGWGYPTNVTLTQNYGISPEGLTNSTRLQFTSNGFMNDALSQVNGTQYTLSIYAKRNDGGTQSFGFYVNGTPTIVGGITLTSDWQRFTYTYTASNSFSIGLAGSSGADVSVYGFQAEQASYPTSYIPNHSGGTITRGVDDCQDAGDTASINSTEGVLYVEASALADDGTSRMIALSDASSNNHIRIYPTTTSNRITIAIKSGNVNQYVYHYDGLSDITETWKVAVKYKANDFATFVNGTKVNSSTSGSAPVGLNELQYNGGNSASPFYGNVKQTLVFPSALSDADCITLTT